MEDFVDIEAPREIELDCDYEFLSELFGEFRGFAFLEGRFLFGDDSRGGSGFFLECSGVDDLAEHPDVVGGGAAATADDACALFNQPRGRFREILWGSVVRNRALDQLREARCWEGKDRKVGGFGELTDDVDHSLRAYDAIRANGHDSEVGHFRAASRWESFAERLAVLDVGLADDDRQIGRAANSFDRNPKFIHVDERLEQETVDASLRQRGGLLTKGIIGFPLGNRSDGSEWLSAGADGT